VASAGAEGCATAQHGVFGAPMAAGLAAAGGYGAAAKVWWCCVVRVCVCVSERTCVRVCVSRVCVCVCACV
jgi:hypothetical protein